MIYWELPASDLTYAADAWPLRRSWPGELTNSVNVPVRRRSACRERILAQPKPDSRMSLLVINVHHCGFLLLDRHSFRADFLSSVPEDEFVGAGGNIFDLVGTVLSGRCEIGILKHQDGGVHIRMDIAIDIHHAGPVEPDRPQLSAGVTSQVEFLRLRIGEHVVEQIVIIREVDRCAEKNGQNQRAEEHL